MTAFRNAYLYLSLLALAVLIGFWPTYFSVISTVTTGPHVHGLLMMLWVAILISQAFLMRSDLKSLHRAIGKSTYVIAPLVVWSGLALAQNVLWRGPGGVTMEEAQAFTLPLAPITSFAICWGLAIYYRKNRELHARFMISTGIVIASAATFRIFFFFVPGFGNNAAATYGAYIPLEILAIGLVIADRSKGFARSPWLVTLVLLAFSHALYFGVEGSAAWHAFTEAFADLPLLQPWEVAPAGSFETPVA